jgi:hypothetical protein
VDTTGSYTKKRVGWILLAATGIENGGESANKDVKNKNGREFLD